MAKDKKKTDDAGGIKILVQNRKARHLYHISDTFEAGLVLEGWEIKSLRNGGATLSESYIRPSKTELFLVGANITPYAYTQDRVVDPVRKRKLLMHRKEIEKLSTRVQEKGFTLVPIKIYLKKGRAKLELGLGKGKDLHDKRQSVKERDAKREMQRALKDYR